MPPKRLVNVLLFMEENPFTTSFTFPPKQASMPVHRDINSIRLAPAHSFQSTDTLPPDISPGSGGLQCGDLPVLQVPKITLLSVGPLINHRL